MQARNKYYLPASNNSKIHRHLDVFVPHNLEGFSVVSCHSTELLHIAQTDNSIQTHKVLMNVNIGKHLIVTKPQLPAQAIDYFCMTADANDELPPQRKRNGWTTTSHNPNGNSSSLLTTV